MTERELRSAVQSLAGDNARLCDRLIAAEKVIDQLRRFIKASTTPSRVPPPDYSLQPLIRLIAEYDAGKPS